MSLVEFFANHTFRMVFMGTTIIGLVAGALGSFAYLRKQSLISDVISHSALPGTLIAFILAVQVGANGRNMIALMAGAIIIGTIAVLCANYITRATKIRIDSAMAITLATFFGLGMLLMRIIANSSWPGKGGIQDYLFGKASVLTKADIRVSAIAGIFALLVVVALWKEFELRIFDPVFFEVAGFRARLVDVAMFCAIVIATVIGVKAVGLVLMVAFVVTPPAAARQWTNSLRSMVLLSALIGGLSSGIGAYLSIAFGNLPTGPLIAIVLFVIFAVSLLIAPGRSIVTKMLARRQANAELLAEAREVVA